MLAPPSTVCVDIVGGGNSQYFAAITQRPYTDITYNNSRTKYAELSGVFFLRFPKHKERCANEFINWFLPYVLP